MNGKSHSCFPGDGRDFVEKQAKMLLQSCRINFRIWREHGAQAFNFQVEADTGKEIQRLPDESIAIGATQIIPKLLHRKPVPR